jgi:CBS domain containing-hemolysin-like protein
LSANGNNKNSKDDHPLLRGLHLGSITFLLSILLTLLSNFVLNKMGLFFAIIFLLIIVFFGVVFDMIGVAVTAASETSFHAMAAKKVFGALQAYRLVRHADRVSSICNDVIGDICGTVSGAAAAIIAFHWVATGVLDDQRIISLFIAGIVAALTVGGKAAGKYLALSRCREITYQAGKILAWLEVNFGLQFLIEKGKMRRR